MCVVVLVVGVPQNACAQNLSYGSYTFLPSTDDFTDEDRSAIATLDESREAGFGWKCMGDGLNVLYIFNKYMAGDSDGEVIVRFRVDKNPPSEQLYWSLSSDHTMAYMPMELVRAFTASAVAGSVVVFEVIDPIDGETKRHKFSLSGVTAAIKQLSCAAYN